MRKQLLNIGYPAIDTVYRWIDKRHVRRTNNIQLIPDFRHRKGGKLSYAEWAHVVGIFQTLMYEHLPTHSSNNILDIGCGTGLLGIASIPFVKQGGSYTGIDVIKEDINYCINHYKFDNYYFKHFDVANQLLLKCKRTD